MPCKKFNASYSGQGLRSEEENMDEDWKPLQCWTYGGEHHKRDYP